MQIKFEKLQSGSLPPKFSEVKYDCGPEDRLVRTNICMISIFKCHLPSFQGKMAIYIQLNLLKGTIHSGDM